MTPEQFLTIKERVDKEPVTLQLEDIEDLSPRTLLYGYTCDRNTWHVYIQPNEATPDPLLHRVEYDHDDQIVSYVSGRALSVADVVPNKRLYPECCDYQVCRKLIKMGAELPFTVFSQQRPVSNFYGKVVNNNQLV